MSKTISTLLVVFGWAASSPVYAHFFIDYQEVAKKTEQKSHVAPEGFDLLTGKYHGLIQEVGAGQPNRVSSFGEDVEVADALSLILPEDWFAYVDQRIEQLPQVSWDANDRPWTHVIADLGKKYGLRFLVDWDQKLLQIASGRPVSNEHIDAPRLMRDERTGREVFIYTQEHQPKGYIILDGEYVPVVIQ